MIVTGFYFPQRYNKMPLKSSLRRRLEVVSARKNGSFLRPLLPSTFYARYGYCPVAQSLFFFFFLARSVFVGRTHKEMKPKAALLKLWEKRSPYCIFICSSTFMNCSMHFAAKLLPLNKVLGLPVKEVRTPTLK